MTTASMVSARVVMAGLAVTLVAQVARPANGWEIAVTCVLFVFAYLASAMNGDW